MEVLYFGSIEDAFCKVGAARLVLCDQSENGGSVGDADACLWSVVESYVAAEGIELDDIEVLGPANGKIVRVTVDAPDGVSVGRVAQLSRGIGRVLESKETVAGSYTLEVSSPGLERKLRRPVHYLKSVGREVKVKTVRQVAGETHHRGELSSADEEGFLIDTDAGERRFAYDDVASARTVFVWQKAGKPGGQR